MPAKSTTDREAGPVAWSRAYLHEALPEGRRARWIKGFGQWDTRVLPQVVGLEIKEIRQDYARMRLPYRSELNQPAGGCTAAPSPPGRHCGGAGLSSAYDEIPTMLTIDMQLRYLGAVRESDIVAEGWITKRGRSIVFCEAEVRTTPANDLAAEAWLTYRVVAP